MEDEFYAELEELEEVEEAEPLDIPENAPSFSLEPLETPCIKRILFSMSRSSLPFLILDTYLRILWKNDAFTATFGEYTDTLGKHINEPFDTLENSGTTPSITSSAKSAETGLSYRGRVQMSSRRRLTKQANILIAPIFKDSEGHYNHCGYTAYFDDVTDENKSILRNTFLSLLHASQMKDNDTGKHIKRVGEYSRLISKYLYEKGNYPEVDAEFIDNITFLAPMHDVGKIGTPDDILNKAGSLDPWEWDIMREHTINGAYIMATYPHEMAKQIALTHHERWDGTGYPYRISEEMIPLSGRIVAIADVYDALRMKRSYKKAYSHEQARAIISESSGSHFDPALVEAFLSISDSIRDVYELLKDEPEEPSPPPAVS